MIGNKTVTKKRCRARICARAACLWSVLFLLLGSGCSYQNLLDLPPVNLEKISQGITSDARKSSVLDNEQTQLDQQREPTQKIKDFTPTTDSQTSTLAQIDTVPKVSKDYSQFFAATAGAEGKEAAAEGILLNFDNADIYEVIQVIASTLNFNYIIDPQVKGVVNIRSGAKIAPDQLFTLFKKILHINGLEIRNEGDYEYIYVSRKPSSMDSKSAAQIRELKDSSKFILQIVPLQYLPSSQAQKLIEPYLSAQGTITNLIAQNTLLISDFESGLINIVRLLAKLDVSPLASMAIKLVRVDNAPLFDLRDELIEIFNALQINTKDYEAVTVVPLERVNSLMLISNNATQIQNGLDWIKELDVMPTQDRDNIYIYNVRNSVASELSELINQLISEESPKSSSSTKKTTTKKTTTKESKAQKTTAKKTTAAKSLSSLRFIGEPVVFADDDRNVILIRALPPDYTRIVKLMERLDNLPRQVLVEVLVAEIQLTNELEFGIEWFVNSTDFSFGTEFTALANPGIIPETAASGLSYSMIGGDVTAFLQALSSRTDVGILSSPQVLVLNNEKATVNVGEQVPIVTTETQNTASADQIDKTVQYKDTGIILDVTPQINYNGIILLEVQQTVSNAVENTVSDISSPVISKRELQTNLAVKTGQTILLGGLIRKDNQTTQSGVPFLMDIPWLGNFFKYQKDKLVKTELIIMITPHVIESEDVLDQYVRDFEEKMKQLHPHLFTPMGITPRRQW